MIFFVFAERSLPAIAMLKWRPERGMLLSILVTPLLEYNIYFNTHELSSYISKLSLIMHMHVCNDIVMQ
jgi:hypothetical protein